MDIKYAHVRERKQKEGLFTGVFSVQFYQPLGLNVYFSKDYKKGNR